MLSTMQNVPLSISRILEYGATAHASTKVTTWRTDHAEETTFEEVRARAAAFANAPPMFPHPIKPSFFIGYHPFAC